MPKRIFRNINPNKPISTDKNCVKIVCIRSFSGPHFPAFGLNSEIYRVNLRIQSKCRKMRTRKTPNTDTFYTAKIPSKLVKFSVNVIYAYLTYIFNVIYINVITFNVFSNSAKIALVRLIFKKKNSTIIENYRPVNTLNCFSKICEIFPYDQLTGLYIRCHQIS